MYCPRTVFQWSCKRLGNPVLRRLGLFKIWHRHFPTWSTISQIAVCIFSPAENERSLDRTLDSSGRLALTSRRPLTDSWAWPTNTRVQTRLLRQAGQFSRYHCSVNNVHVTCGHVCLFVVLFVCFFFRKQSALGMCRSNHEFELTWCCLLGLSKWAELQGLESSTRGRRSRGYCDS